MASRDATTNFSRSIDTDALRRTISLASVIGARVKLTRRGDEWLGLCPFHAEHSPSFTVNETKGFYHCFGCGAHGDVIRFVADFHGLDFRAACAMLDADNPRHVDRPARNRPRSLPPRDFPLRDHYADLIAIDGGDIVQAGEEIRCWNPKRPQRPWVTYRPSMVFPYQDANGKLIGYVLRIDLPAQGGHASRKITPTIRYARLPTGETAWCHWAFDKPRPLYRLPDLTARQSDPVLIVEGEKAAEAARRLAADLPFVVTTWPGGAKAVQHVDWSPLMGRDVLLWGDADAAGESAMLGHGDDDGRKRDGVAQLCDLAGAKRIRFIPWDRQRPKGWDAADAEAEGWQASDFRNHLDVAAHEWEARNWVAPRTASQVVASPKRALQTPHLPANDIGNSPDGEDQPPFRVLGFNRGSYYYLPRATQQVVTLTAAAHTRAHLLTLAPLRYWAKQYPGRNGFDLDSASDALITAAHRAGLFTLDRLRGRGAWRDRGKVVMHLGRWLCVDGRLQDPASMQCDHIYEAAPDLGESSAIGGTSAIGEPTSIGNGDDVTDALPPPATTAEANHLVQICRRLTWENDLSGDLLAGWCVIAPLCGVLSWRPHLWITGPAQAGKSTVIKDIIQRVISIFALYVDGKTTEAGIRQLLGADARPVIIDEIESKDLAAAARVQQILDMARVSSSGGTVVKGSTTGRPMSYTLRACFCFSSINTAVAHYADETRISKLVLRRNEAPDADRHYRDLMRDIDDWFTPDYARRMLARSLSHLDILLANAKTFTSAAARVLHSRRAADQIGTMLAGLHLCYSAKAISIDEAEAWIKARDWLDHTAIGAAGDETRLLERLATRRLRMPVSGGHREVSVGQAIMTVHDQAENYADWSAELCAHGFKVDGDDVLIANNASPLKKMLEGTAWASDWLRPLRMLPGASAVPNTYFSPGLKCRATRIPLKLLGKEG